MTIEENSTPPDSLITRRALITASLIQCAGAGMVHAPPGKAGDLSNGSSKITTRKFAKQSREISHSARAVLDKVVWKSYSGMQHIRGFNYQPSWGHDARSIWLDRFDPVRYREELLLGKRFFPAFNCVRIWLGYGAYQSNPDLLVNNFNAAIDICAELGLLVIPVLFTVWSGDPPFDPISEEKIVGVDHEATYAKYIDDVVSPNYEDRNILAWDLCNEPLEGNPLSVLQQSQARWLKFIHDRVKSIDPSARTCIGTMSDFGGWQSFTEYCDILTPHLYGYSLWKPGLERWNVRLEFETWFECMVDHYVIITSLVNKPKPILCTESCWGACDDLVRQRIIRATLAPLKRHGIGFLAHALHTSGVADLHIPSNCGPMNGGFTNPASMAFINPDGNLRPGHDIFNNYCD